MANITRETRDIIANMDANNITRFYYTEFARAQAMMDDNNNGKVLDIAANLLMQADLPLWLRANCLIITAVHGSAPYEETLNKAMETLLRIEKTKETAEKGMILPPALPRIKGLIEELLAESDATDEDEDEEKEATPEPQTPSLPRPEPQTARRGVPTNTATPTKPRTNATALETPTKPHPASSQTDPTLMEEVAGKKREDRGP